MVSKLSWGIRWTLIKVHKSHKICTLMGFVCSSEKKCSVMTLKGDAKFKGNLSCGLKNDIRNLVNFHVSSWKPENLHFDGFLLSKAYKVLDEKVQKNYLSWHLWVMQSLKKNGLLFAKMTITNLINFNTSSGKSENLHFNVLLLSTAYKVSAKKVQQSFLSWHWRVVQTLKKDLLFVWKMTWIIWWILTRAGENQNLHFNGIFLSKVCNV